MVEVLEKVIKIIVDCLGVEEFKVILEVFFKEDLGVDFLDVVELVMEFEDEFGVEIFDGDVENINIVGDVVKYIEVNV